MPLFRRDAFHDVPVHSRSPKRPTDIVSEKRLIGNPAKLDEFRCLDRRDECACLGVDRIFRDVKAENIELRFLPYGNVAGVRDIGAFEGAFSNEAHVGRNGEKILAVLVQLDIRDEFPHDLVRRDLRYEIQFLAERCNPLFSGRRYQRRDRGCILELRQRTRKFPQRLVADCRIALLRNRRLQNDDGFVAGINIDTVYTLIPALVAHSINRVLAVQPIVVFQIPDQKRRAFGAFGVDELLEIVQDCRIGEIQHKLLMVHRMVGDSEVIQFGIARISTGKSACVFADLDSSKLHLVDYICLMNRQRFARYSHADSDCFASSPD